MIEKQREKEFLSELERLYYNYCLVVDCTIKGVLKLRDVSFLDTDWTTERIELYLDTLRVETRGNVG